MRGSLRPPVQITFASAGLLIMAVWTLVIKFLAPVLYWAAGDATTPPVMWDFWWVAHLWLAWLIWGRRHLAIPAGTVISLVEIAIVVIKFWFYLAEPEITFWRLLWFTNKCYVLAFFIGLAWWYTNRDFRGLFAG